MSGPVVSDPTQPPFGDPFSSTGPYAGPPETWGTLAAVDDARQVAVSLGPRHGELVASLRQLAAQNGGGHIGLGRGMLSRLLALDIVTAADRDRVAAILDHLQAHIGVGPEQQTTGLTQLQAFHQALLDDPTSSVCAVTISAVALDSVSRALSDDAPDFIDGFAAGVSDTTGALVGSVGGPLAALVVGAGFSAFSLGPN